MQRLTIEQNLKIYNSEIKKNDLEYCLMDCLGQDRTFLHTQKEYLLTKEEQYKFNNYTKQLKKSIPLAYITGSQPFYKNQFIVSPEVLIPRPETEILVEEVINSGEKMYPKNQPVRILDLGAGTGCIGLSIAAEKPEWLIYLSDIEIEIARIMYMNKIKLNLKNCEIIVTDWMSAFSKNSFDIIVTNPPYIDKSSIEVAYSVKKYEPKKALFADDSGLSHIKSIIASSKKSLKKNGYLFIENGYDQSQQVTKFLANHDFKDIDVLLDYNDICRFTKCRYEDG